MKAYAPSAAARRVWMYVASWTLFIYLTIPLARSLQGWVYQHLGRSTFLYVVFAALVTGVVVAVCRLRGQAAPVRASSWWWLAGVACALAGGTWHLRANPEEAMHFVQYGVLSFLLYRAFRTRFDDSGLFVAAFLAGTFVGVLDECIQWIVPRRFFDFRDMVINVSGVGLVQLALARGLRPEGVSSPSRAQTLWVAFRIATSLALFFVILLAATPARIAALPWGLGAYLVNEPLVEYGNQITVSNDVHFVSRLTGPDLLVEDERRQAEVGPLMARHADERDYEQFLLEHPSWQDPFVHEMRVHLFRRDRYSKDARAHRRDPERQAKELTVAYREQQILEAYFGRTLAAAGLDWPADVRERASAMVKPGEYQSPVSRHLIVRWRRWQLQGLVVLAWMVFGAWVRYAARREESTS